MKIGILTLRLDFNYGGIVQAYALQKVLQDLGYDAKLVELHPLDLQKSFSQRCFLFFKRLLKKIIKDKNTELFLEKNQKRVFSFVEQNIERIFWDRDNKFNDYNFDVLIVGSDQIWRPKYVPFIIDEYFLDFAENWDIKRISYAASFGTDKWEFSTEQTQRCGELLKKFDAVSVRESSGVSLCKNYFGVDAKWVLDPTMLVSENHYMFQILKVPQKYDVNLCLGYLLDFTQEKQEIFDKIVKYKAFTKLLWKNVNSVTSNSPSVEEWLKGFYSAEFVFTDSFHGCVFSIIFNKPFIVFGNKDRGLSRFNSLLDLFDLEDLLITNIAEFGDDKINLAISKFSSDKVKNKLNNLRKESLSFLVNNLISDIR